MSSITPGTGATLKSATAEGQLLEIFDFVQLQQLDAAKNPDGRRFLTSTYAINTGICSGSFNCPYTRSLNTEGQAIINIANYLTGVTFTPGTSGTFKSANPIAYAFEVLMYLQILEGDINKNPTNENRVSCTIDDNTLLVNSSFSMPFTHTLNSDGSTKLAGKAYLL